MEDQKIIYDLGANNGDDLPYYLEKAHKVIAVEALPERARGIRERFRAELNSGRLVVENVAVVDSSQHEGHIDIWIHHEDAKSTVVSPSTDVGLYTKSRVPAIAVTQLIEKHGDPYFIKVDLENYDATILKALFQGGIFPPFISSEGHDPSVFGLLVGMGNYNSFKFVRGRRVEREFRNFTFRNLSGESRTFSFPWGSAGPFGDDIPGPWLEKMSAFAHLRLLGSGWFDIHSSFEKGDAIEPRLSLDEILGTDLVEFLRPPLSRRLRKLRRLLRAVRRFFGIK